MKTNLLRPELRALISLALLATTITLATPSRADNKKQAKALFKEGMAAIEKENYLEALTVFEESYKLIPKPALLFNIAMCQKALFRYVDSIATFKQYIADAGDKIKPGMRQAADNALAEMDRLVGKLILQDAPNDAEVFVDGKPAGKTPFKEGLILDPGQHTVRITLKGHKPLNTDITVASGAEISMRAALAEVAAWIKIVCEASGSIVRFDEKIVGECPYEGEVNPGIHQVTVTSPNTGDFSKEVEVKPGASLTVSVGATETATDNPGVVSSKLKIAGIVFTGLSVGAASMGLAFNIKGSKDEQKAIDAPANSSERKGFNEDISTDKTMMVVGYAAAGALLTTGVILLILDAKKHNKQKTVAIKPAFGKVALTF